MTKAVVDGATPPPSGRAFLRHDLVRGLALRIAAHGAKALIFEARIKGRPRRLTLASRPDMNVAQARQRALELRAATTRPKDAAEARRGPGSTAEVDFWTSRDVREVVRSHLNYVVARPSEIVRVLNAREATGP